MVLARQGGARIGMERPCRVRYGVAERGKDFIMTNLDSERGWARIGEALHGPDRPGAARYGIAKRGEVFKLRGLGNNSER